MEARFIIMISRGPVHIAILFQLQVFNCKLSGQLESACGELERGLASDLFADSELGALRCAGLGASTV